MNKAYFFNVGWDQARDLLDEPEFGRFGGAELDCWWAGYYSWKAGLPRMRDSEEEFNHAYAQDIVSMLKADLEE